jgi:8-oxo-dGTP pyrophosphatase MutT (NUDIX family)
MTEPDHRDLAEQRTEYGRDRWPIAAAGLVTDERGRVLLVNPTYHRDRWLMPGGGMERGSSPRTTCARELHEELGLDLPVGRLLVVDWVPDDGRLFEEVVFVFDAGTLDPQTSQQIRLPADELSGWAFLAPDDAAERLLPADARRLDQALRVKTDGEQTAYLEAGNSHGC